MQVTISGDIDPEVVEKAFLEYMGTIPARTTPLPLPHVPVSFNTNLTLEQRHMVRRARSSAPAPTHACSHALTARPCAGVAPERL
jgi:hypothetical protein